MSTENDVETDTCRTIEVDGETVRVRGAGNPSPEAAGAIAAVVRAARDRMETEDKTAKIEGALYAAMERGGIGYSSTQRKPAVDFLAPILSDLINDARQQVAQQIATKADEIAEQYQATAVTHRDISIETGRNTPKGQSHMRTAHAYRSKADGAWAVAHAAREIGGLA